MPVNDSIPVAIEEQLCKEAEKFENLWWEKSMNLSRFYDDPIDPNMDIRRKLTEFLRKPGVVFTNGSISSLIADSPDSFELTLSGYYANHYYTRSLEIEEPTNSSRCYPLKIKNVIFSNPATIVFWEDGTKTVVKCENEEFDKEKGLAMAFMKKMLGNKGRYFNEVKKWTRRDQ